MHEYLGLEGGPPNFRQDFTCPALLEYLVRHCAYGTVTHHVALSNAFGFFSTRSLAWSAFARRY
jgi:hypothetical protein